jgi:SAM-dependent methyltransferase
LKSFADHFSRIAAGYAAYRPRYPDSLFAWLVSVVPDRSRAWDCATGNGQAAAALSRQFEHVVATDPSVAQLEQAEQVSNVEYVASTAEDAPLAGASVSLVAVAQALHWFDRPAFYVEARRALAPGGVLAVWCYGLCTVGDSRLDAALHRFHTETLAPYWPAERALVDEGFGRLEFPFDELGPPRFAMTADWTLTQLAGYLSTWSAVQRARAETGADPLPELVDTLHARWAPDHAVRRVEWPLSMRVGRV